MPDPSETVPVFWYQCLALISGMCVMDWRDVWKPWTKHLLLAVLVVYSNSLESLSFGSVLPDCSWGGGTAILSNPHGLCTAAGDPDGQGRTRDWTMVTRGGAPKEVVAGGTLVPGTQWSAVCSPSSSCCSFGSYCVFSSRAISRSSLSPNSPPINVGSPTTITSCTTDTAWYK